MIQAREHMEKTRTLLILIGNGIGRQKEAIRSLCAEQEFEEISLFGTPECEFPVAVKTERKDFLNQFIEMIDPLRIGNEYYGVRKEDIVFGHSDRKVVAVPAQMAESLYLFSTMNSVAPVVINFEADLVPSLISKQWMEINTESIDEIPVPIAMTVFADETISAKAMTTVAKWATNYMNKQIDFSDLREKSLGDGRAHDLLKTISDDSSRKSKIQKMAALALAAGMSAAGNVEIAIAMLGSFYLARNAMHEFNEKNTLFKEQGFSLTERLNYFVFGHDDSSEGAPSYTEKEKNVLYALIDKVEKKFGALNISAQKMDDVRDLYDTVRPSFFKKNGQDIQTPIQTLRGIR